MSNPKIPSRSGYPAADTSAISPHSGQNATHESMPTGSASAPSTRDVPHALSSLPARPAPRARPGETSASPDATPFPKRNFQKGDLVYGVEKGLDGGIGRKHYIDYRFRARMTPCRIDDFRILKNEQALAPKMPEADEQSFRETLSHHEKYSNALGGQDNSAVRRKVKGGLEWATRVADKHVHFVLDSLDIDAVVNKNFSVDVPADASDNLAPGETKNRAYTGAELRWVYRNREDPRVQKNVHFWMNRQQVPPPWQEYKKESMVIADDGPQYTTETVDVDKLWRNYVPKRKPDLPE
ncbi:hypothetical protein [Pandoraea anhela]|uniref:Uncharacterized protein n=1 Tax=Pandoraea anhela TaxID=2508295 RepID=A0A5E4VYD7_9BURK|nr:hypothetical protein [Pandoraea anhela]VVE17161.1 hypothetical protein PAN31108_02932 [Pandoraea anhela]